MVGYEPTPQTWSFIKYGGYSPNLYNGSMQLEVPFYTYRDSDFEFSLSMGYSTNGFYPLRQTGILGLGWYLNAGGSITREIRGVPDERNFQNGFSGFRYYDNVTYSDSLLLGFGIGDGSTDSYSVGGSETESDIFHFSFPGHSGSFHFNGSREAVVYGTSGSHGTYKISWDSSVNTITITTGDGYIWLFGGAERFLERNLAGLHDFLTEMSYSDEIVYESSTIVTWQLHSVTAPNGRQVIYEYNNGELYCGSLKRGANRNNYVVTFSQGLNLVDNGGFIPTTMYKRVNATKTTYLSGITVGNTSFVFNYSEKASPEISNSNIGNNGLYRSLVHTLLKLDNIRVMYNSDTIKNCNMYYRTKDYRLILDSLYIPGEGRYSMFYNDSGTLPDIVSNATDFWGYYNGRNDNSDDFIAATGATSTGEEFISSNIKMPNGNYSVFGTLRLLIYPTGGYTEIDYEPNRARYGVFRRVSGGGAVQPIDPDGQGGTGDPSSAFFAGLYFYSTLFNNVTECGGVRVSRIIDHDALHSTLIRRYDYTSEDGASSGIMLSFPRHYAINNILVPFVQLPANTFDRGHIEYSQVKERLSDGSCTEYFYNSYLNCPDNYSGQKKKKKTFSPFIQGADSLLINNLLRLPNSNHLLRGRPYIVRSYRNDGTLVQEEHIMYARDNIGSSVDYSTFILGSGKYWWSGKLYTGDYRLLKREIINYYDNSTSSRSIERYYYNEKGQYRRIVLTDTTGTSRCKWFKYLYEVPSAPQLVLTKHLLYYPYSSVNTIVKDDTEYITSSNKYEYQAVSGMIKPLSIDVALITTPILSTNPLSAPLSYITEALFNSFDSQGNITQTTDVNGLITTYLWGYNGLYPLAIIQNVLYSSVLSKLSLPPSALPFEYGLSKAQINSLREISGSSLRLFDYTPLVGTNTIITPSGRVNNYFYDSFGRLIRIKKENHITNTMIYKF